jgi:hypothetical protein
MSIPGQEASKKAFSIQPFFIFAAGIY